MKTHCHRIGKIGNQLVNEQETNVKGAVLGTINVRNISVIIMASAIIGNCQLQLLFTG